MSSNFDVEHFGESLDDDALVELVKTNTDEPSVLGALKELSRRKSSRCFELCQAVLDNPNQSARSRRLAVSHLRRQQQPENQELLLKTFDDRDPALFSKIVQSLAMTGDEEALSRLEQAEPPVDDFAARSLNFAKVFLSHRLRLERNLIPIPSDSAFVEVSDGIAFEVTNAEPGAMADALTEIESDLPTLSLAVEGAARLSCRSTELFLVFIKEFEPTGTLETIKERSALPLVILRNDLSIGTFFIDQFLFTQPADANGNVALLGTRPNGELTCAGTIQVSDREFTFNLRSVDTRYAPAIDVEGSYDSVQKEFRFSKAYTSTRIAAKENRPQPPQKATPRF